MSLKVTFEKLTCVTLDIRHALLLFFLFPQTFRVDILWETLDHFQH